MVGVAIREFLPWQHLLSYVEAILRVYNRYGRRDNIHKARIKILVKERGAEKFPRRSGSGVGADQGRPLDADGGRSGARRSALRAARSMKLSKMKSFRVSLRSRPGPRRNVHRHKKPGYVAVTLSLKKTGVPPGDVTSDQMEAIRRPRRALFVRRACACRTSRT
jgi:sulfite reductase (NADPH) hemoprotein beta-component